MPAALECPKIECWQALFGDTIHRTSRKSTTPPGVVRGCQDRLRRAEDCGDAMLQLVRRIGDRPPRRPTQP